jgi:hypothetical protein
VLLRLAQHSEAWDSDGHGRDELGDGIGVGEEIAGACLPLSAEEPGRGASMEEGAPGRLFELERRNGGRSRCLDGVDAREGRSRGVADLGVQEGSPDLGKSRPRGNMGGRPWGIPRACSRGARMVSS